jgi:hypothetical protein
MSQVLSPSADSKPTRRWFQLTPDRLIVDLLVLECLMWLSDCLRWFPLNRRPGLTVLIAVAILIGAVVGALLWFIAASILRLRFQFSLRALLVGAVAVAIPCSWLAVEIKRAKDQVKVVTAIQSLGGSVKGQADVDVPGWLVRWFGEAFFTKITAVYLPADRITNDGIARIQQALPNCHIEWTPWEQPEH